MIRTILKLPSRRSLAVHENIKKQNPNAPRDPAAVQPRVRRTPCTGDLRLAPPRRLLLPRGLHRRQQDYPVFPAIFFLLFSTNRRPPRSSTDCHLSFPVSPLLFSLSSVLRTLADMYACMLSICSFSSILGGFPAARKG